MKQVNKFIFHPFIFSIYPILALTAFNIGHVYFVESVRSLLLGLLFGVVLYLLLNWMIKDRNKAALSSSLVIFVFFMYGHVYNLLKDIDLGGFLLGRHRVMLPIAIILLSTSLFFVMRTKRDIARINETLNLISILLMIFPIITLINAGLSSSTSDNNSSNYVSSSNLLQRDIYYIVLDAYGRDDTLQELFNFDNSAFISDLEDLGFFVPECSQSNYDHTQPSISAALNMDYEENLWDGENWHSRDFYQAIYNNQTRLFLEKQGYQTIAFESGMVFTEWVDADVYMKTQDENLFLRSSFNRFEVELVETTLLKGLLDYEPFAEFLQLEIGALNNRQDEILNILDGLREVPGIEGPKFVFAHLISPHRPFVFGPSGEDMINEIGIDVMEMDYGIGYVNQVQFLNQQVLEIVETIIEESEEEPIIIIHGDHGPDFVSLQYRASIFSAFYFPDSGSEGLYNTISPVNYFRLIQNQYFRTQNEILPDISYQADFRSRPNEYQVIYDFGRCED